MNSEYASKASIAASMLRSYVDKPFVNYEWEELVEKMCKSDDPALRGKGLRELADLKKKDSYFKVMGC